MVSIEVHGGPTPHASVRDAVDWGRVVVATLARGTVATVLGLALWAAAPAVIGWQPTTVMTGSMEPRITPGDVEVARPVPVDEVRPGRILLADDPDQPGHLRMHRFVEAGPGGTLVTKGDANPQRDSTLLEPAAVHGVAFLRVPLVGAPILWLHDGEWGRVGALALGVVALLALCTIDGSLRRLVESVASDADDDGDAGASGRTGGGGRHRADGGREARVDPATRLRSGTHARHAQPARAGRRTRPAVGVVGVLVLAVGSGVPAPTSAQAAPFFFRTATTTSFEATTAVGVTSLVCKPGASSGTVSIEWGYSGVPVSSFDLMNGTTPVATTTDADARSLTYGGSGLLAVGTPYTLRVRTNLSSGWVANSAQTVSVRVTSVAGLLNSASCA